MTRSSPARASASAFCGSSEPFVVSAISRPGIACSSSTRCSTFRRTSGSPPVMRTVRTPSAAKIAATRAISSSAQQLRALEELVVAAVDLLRHAVDAAEVAAVGDRDAQRLERPAERVEERLHADTVPKRRSRTKRASVSRSRVHHSQGHVDRLELRDRRRPARAGRPARGPRRRLQAVRDDGRGGVVLVGGEAGVGKTALLRRFCDERRRSARVLWGACDPLFTPRPLGPLLDVAEAPAASSRSSSRAAARPHEVVAALARELRRRAPTVFVLEDVHWADEATLDVLRLLARRVETVPRARRRQLPRRRARPRRTRFGSCSASSRRAARSRGSKLAAALAGGGRASSPSRTASTRTSSTARPAATRSSSPRCSPPAAEEIPDTVRDAVLARAARLSAAARGRCSRRSRSCPPQAELWLLEALRRRRRSTASTSA